MEIPFLSSGAINREHYNLVQSVESASTPWHVDEILIQKVETLRRWFEKRTWRPLECGPSLIMLLYCWTTTSLGRVTRAKLEFALPHALVLAEAGNSLKEKRIGYLFCTEVMDKTDELQLMVVNTLRKDLVGLDPARICLALDVLLLNCPMEAIPAVTPRLIDLLAHDSSHVKRKALAVVRNISRHDPELLINAYEKVTLRLKDPDLRVVDAALRLLEELPRAHIIEPLEVLQLILRDFVSSHGQSFGIRYVQVIGNLILNLPASNSTPEIISDVIATIFRMLDTATNANQAFVLECFRAVSRVPTKLLERYLTTTNSKVWSLLGQSLKSPKPNTQFFCISCLLEMDPILWAGVAEGIPSPFDEGQVHTIMGFLDSPDSIIRTKTLQVLGHVDQEILLTHLAGLTSAFRSSAPAKDSALAERALEVAAVYEQDGSDYARRLSEVCLQAGYQNNAKGKRKVTDSGAGLVSENIVEQVLLHLRNSSDNFRGDFVDAIVRIPVSETGPTLTLVIAATVCEHGALSTIPQEDLLQDLAMRLGTTPPAIQEALLLSMLRVTARCGSAVTEVSNNVRSLHEISRSHIRHRCDQYLTHSERMASLELIVEHAKSDTLPDFLLALEGANTHPQDSSPKHHRSSVSATSEKSPQSNLNMRGTLRYEAYEAPPPAAKFTHRRSSTSSVDSQTTGSYSGRSDSTSASSAHKQNRKRDIETGTDGDIDDALSRTMTAGDLALAAHKFNLAKPASIDALTAGSQGNSMPPVNSRSKLIEDLVGADLISLDSPFLVEPTEPSVAGANPHPPVDFKMIWDALTEQPNIRGWSESTVDELEGRILAMAAHQVIVIPQNILPYPGEIKLVISARGSSGTSRDTGLLAAVRIRPEDEASALWQMRCFGATMQAELKSLLEGS